MVSTTTASTSAPMPAANGPAAFTRLEVAASMAKFPWSPTSPHPAYIIIHNNVYDIRDLINEHPGGSVILTHLGVDGTDAFEAFHPEGTSEVLADYYAGSLVPEDVISAQSELARRMHELKQDYTEAGYFKPKYTFFLLQFALLMCIASTSLALLWLFPSSVPVLLVSAALMGLFWQQCGWLSHDFLHHAVFRQRELNNWVGYFLGGVCQGFSVRWWKDKHNTHHAQPNVHGEDPDVDTMPLLAWSDYALEMFPDSTVAKWFVPRQAILYFPILAVARVSWAIQSALYVTPLWEKPTKTPISTAEQLSVALHWIWYLGVLTTRLSPAMAVMYFAASQAFCGLFLASVFSLNHNGMDILSRSEADKTDFFTKQIRTGRDVAPSMFMNWFCGGLNFQIEHHLFPMMPRHHYPKIKSQIQQLCAEFGVPHHTTGFWAGTGEVLSRLSKVADSAIKMANHKKMQ